MNRWDRQRKKENTYTQKKEVFFSLISEIKFLNTCSTTAKGNLVDVRFI